MRQNETKTKKPFEVRQAVVPAAGLGTRFLPITHALPKELLPIYDLPALEIVLMEARNAGVEHVALVTSRLKPSLEAHFDRSPFADLEISFVYQDEPLGLGHAVACGLKAFQELGDGFAVMLPDQIFFDEGASLSGLIQNFSRLGHSVISLEKVPEEHVSRYGIVEGTWDESPAGERLLTASRLLEKPQARDTSSRWAMPGRYVLSKSIRGILEGLKPGVKGELQLTDALDALARQGLLHGAEAIGPIFDTGNPQGLLEAAIYRYSIKNPGRLRELVSRREFSLEV